MKHYSIIYPKCKGHNLSGSMCKRRCKEGWCYRHKNQSYKWSIKPEECPICKEEFKEEDKNPLYCGHWVCSGCMINWGKFQCPICKKYIKVNSVIYNQIIIKVREAIKNVITILDNDSEEITVDDLQQILTIIANF